MKGMAAEIRWRKMDMDWKERERLLRNGLDKEKISMGG